MMFFDDVDFSFHPTEENGFKKQIDRKEKTEPTEETKQSFSGPQL